MSNRSFSGEVGSAKSNETLLKHFDPFAILKPEKLSTNDVIDVNNSGYKYEIEHSGSLMDTKREISATDLIDNIFVTPDQVTSKKTGDKSLLVPSSVRTLDIDWVGRGIRRELDEEFAKFFDKYEEAVNHVKVSNLVEITDVDKSDSTSRGDADLFGSLDDRPKVLVPKLDVLEAIQNNFKSTTKDIGVVHEVFQNDCKNMYFIEKNSTQINQDEYESVATAEFDIAEYNTSKYPCDDIDDLIDELIYEKSFEKLNLNEKFSPEKCSSRNGDTQLQTSPSKINNIEKRNEIRSTIKEYGTNNSIHCEDLRKNSNIRLPQPVHKDMKTFATQKPSSSRDNFITESILFKNIREERDTNIVTEYILKDSIVEEDIKISNAKMDNIKLLETVKKDVKKHVKCKRKLLNDEDKKNCTKALGLHHKSVVLPKIMERLNMRKEKLNDDAKLQKRQVLDERMLKLNIEADRRVSMYRISNAGSPSSLNVDIDRISRSSTYTDCPNIKTQMQNEMPPLSLEVLMEDCNRERLLEFKRRKLLREYIRCGIDLSK